MAIAVGLNIVVTGTSLIRRSMAGLMDSALPQNEVQSIQAEVLRLLPPDATINGLRTRKAGPRRFIEFNLLLPGATSVSDSHALCDKLEAAIGAALPQTFVSIHVEPQEKHD
jgi:divalent metal cation (Fe/Co/Zn/Cd) transporter